MTRHCEMREGTHVLALARTERVFLWSIRAWFACRMNVTLVWPCLEQAFAHEGMRCALMPFHEFMSAVFSGLHRSPDIRCLHSLHLGAQEALMLTALAHLQHDHEIDARSALREWLLHSALRAVTRHGAACVKGAKAAGLHFAPLTQVPAGSDYPAQRIASAQPLPTARALRQLH